MIPSGWTTMWLNFLTLMLLIPLDPTYLGSRTSGYTTSTQPVKVQRLPGKVVPVTPSGALYPADLSFAQDKINQVIARNGVNVAVEIIANRCYGIAVATKIEKPKLHKFWLSQTTRLRACIPKTTNPSKQSGYDIEAAVNKVGLFGATECVARACDKFHKENPNLTWGQLASDLRKTIPPKRKIKSGKN